MGGVGIGPPRHVVILPGAIAARIRIATIAARVTTIVGRRMMAIIAIGMPAAVVVEAVRIIMIEAASIVAIEAVRIVVVEAVRIVMVGAGRVIMIEAASIIAIEVARIVMVEAAAVILIEAARIIVVEAAAVIAVDPPVAAIAGIRIAVPPHHVPMRVLPFCIQLVAIFAHGGAVVPGICVAGRSHFPEHLANAATAIGLPKRRGTSAIWSGRSGSCIAGRSRTR